MVITGACLTTSVGLVAACGEFLAQRFTRVSYPVIIAILCLFSFTMANLGLSQLIAVSIPLLIALYPIAIVLIVLSLLHAIKPIHRFVYMGAMIGAGLVSLAEGLNAAGLKLSFLSSAVSFLPFSDHGVGWVVPAIAGGFIGFLFYSVKFLSPLKMVKD